MRKRQPAGRPKATCSKCGFELEENRKGKQRYCNACHAQNMRINRPKHSELSDEQREKANARSYLRVYIKRGKIEKLPCLFCGNPNSEAHHQDYSKPLEVTWLCKEHHLMIHENPPVKTEGVFNPKPETVNVVMERH